MTVEEEPEPVVPVETAVYTVPSPEGDGTLVSLPLPVFSPGEITDVDDPRLDPWRPDEVVVKRYINRFMPNGVKDVDFLLTFWAKRENVLLVGDTQSGKTMLVQVLAVLAGQGTKSGKPLPVFTLSGSSGVTDFDLFGQPTPFLGADNVERLVNLPGVVDLAVRAGGILYLDELNFMGERTVSSLHSVCDWRRNFVNRSKAVRYEHNGEEVFMPEVVSANDDLWVVSTINPGYRGTSLGEAITNRFRWIPWGYDENVEKKLIPSAAIRLLAQAVREARANHTLKTPVGTAALTRMCEDAVEHGPEMAVWMFKAMFDASEHARLDAILTDRSIMMLLEDEAASRRQAAQPQPTVTDEDTVGHANPLTGGWSVQP